ncbi:piggyBac transposable element-derived protein 4-like [Scomber japonicus]|uniref:piggyBac transposable element-derived protein 4-like n=1 Tax=Scomber japonicus TaxID=13676 RepID=UPI0023064491|nr:piggyBac transposable element-derived protein 4-like [Scomber japonicus]
MTLGAAVQTSLLRREEAAERHRKDPRGRMKTDSMRSSTRIPTPCEVGKDGTVWSTIHPGGHPGGRHQAQNVLTESAGPTAFAKRNIEDAQSAFSCLLDQKMLHHVCKCTVAEAHRVEKNNQWDLTVRELKAFLALLFVRGVYNKNIEMESFWSEEWGLAFFNSTMPRSRYREIMRFDKKESRRARLSTDKFALMSHVWRSFVNNCVACYKPGPNITVDEQLFPTKARCRFTQYMANKPDKFGIKFWIAADVETKYMLNAFPYLGKDLSRPKSQSVGESVVMRLMEPYLGKGRNVTTDNFFTSLTLSKSLLKRNTSLVGTMKKARRELPPSVASQRGELFATKLLRHERSILTVYQGKPKKSVALLSSMHHTVAIGTDRKRKPETVTFYNTTKVGVDVLDQMARLYSVKGATRRWPVAVFCNILDMAAINAYILCKRCMPSNIARRAFILQLAGELRAEHVCAKAGPAIECPLAEPQQTDKRRQCQVNIHCKQNKTKVCRGGCKRPVCGKCTVRVETFCSNCVPLS